MDLNTVKDITQPVPAESIRPWQAGDAWLVGGTWLFSEPQPDISKFIHPDGKHGPSLTASADGLEIGGNCTISELNDLIAPHDWIAAPLLKECCRSLLTSSMVWNSSPMDQNASMALPMGALISLASALEGACTIWPLHGTAREIPMIDFITGNHQNALAPGEVLRSVWIPAAVLKKHYTVRRFSLSASGRSAVLLVGTLCPDSGKMVLTITAANQKPVQWIFPEIPSAKAVHLAINEHMPFDHHVEDVHGSPLHRRHLTYHYAEKILQELAMI